MKWWLSASSPPCRAGMLWNTNAFRPCRLVNLHFPLSAERFSSQASPLSYALGFSLACFSFTHILHGSESQTAFSNLVAVICA